MCIVCATGGLEENKSHTFYSCFGMNYLKHAQHRSLHTNLTHSLTFCFVLLTEILNQVTFFLLKMVVFQLVGYCTVIYWPIVCEDHLHSVQRKPIFKLDLWASCIYDILAQKSSSLTLLKFLTSMVN